MHTRGAATPFRVRSHVSYYRASAPLPHAVRYARLRQSRLRTNPRKRITIIYIVAIYTSRDISCRSLLSRAYYLFIFFRRFTHFFRVSCVRVHRDRRVSLRRPRRQRSTFVPCPIADRGRSPRPALTSSDYRQRPYVTATTAARKDKVGDFFL